MGKKEIESSISSFEEIITSIEKGAFAPFYLLMGEEPYYNDIIMDRLLSSALTPEERGFNQTVLYGQETNGIQVVEWARRFPMISSRQIVVVKEAQLLEKADQLEHYFRQPLSSTILVVSYTSKSVDKRTALYKTAKQNGVVFESFSLYQDMVFSWIERYLKKRSLTIAPDAGMLMAEYCGTELRKLAIEMDKLILSIPAGTTKIEVKHIEDNVGISRIYNVFELTKAISFRDTQKAFTIIKHISDSPKQFPLVITVATLFLHFSRILKYHAAVSGENKPRAEEISSYIGINRFFLPEYEQAARNFPLIKCMEAISHIRKYDSISKSNLRGESSDGDILVELVYKIMH